MDQGTLTVTLEDKRQGAPGEEPTGKDGAQPASDAKAKDPKAAPERKRSRNLAEDKRFKLFSGTANRPLADEIARHIGVPLGEAKLERP